METSDVMLRNEIYISEEMQPAATTVENRRPSVKVPTKAMLKQGAAGYPFQYHVQEASSSASTGKGRGQGGAQSSLSSPQDNREKIVTPSSSSTVHPQQTCCIIDKNQRCHQYVGRNVYNKEMQKMVKTIKSLQIKADSRARHIGMCDYHKTMIEGVIEKNLSKSKKRSYRCHHSDDTESDGEDGTEVKSPGIDFSRFPLATLQKYKKFFSIPGQLSKAQLTDAIARHFKTVPVLKNQKEIIQDFVSKVKYTRGRERTSED